MATKTLLVITFLAVSNVFVDTQRSASSDLILEDRPLVFTGKNWRTNLNVGQQLWMYCRERKEKQEKLGKCYGDLMKQVLLTNQQCKEEMCEKSKEQALPNLMELKNNVTDCVADKMEWSDIALDFMSVLMSPNEMKEVSSDMIYIFQLCVDTDDMWMSPIKRQNGDIFDCIMQVAWKNCQKNDPEVIEKKLKFNNFMEKEVELFCSPRENTKKLKKCYGNFITTIVELETECRIATCKTEKKMKIENYRRDHMINLHRRIRDCLLRELKHVGIVQSRDRSYRVPLEYIKDEITTDTKSSATQKNAPESDKILPFCESKKFRKRVPEIVENGRMIMCIASEAWKACDPPEHQRPKLPPELQEKMNKQMREFCSREEDPSVKKSLLSCYGYGHYILYVLERKQKCKSELCETISVDNLPSSIMEFRSEIVECVNIRYLVFEFDEALKADNYDLGKRLQNRLEDCESEESLLGVPEKFKNVKILECIMDVVLRDCLNEK